MSTPKDAQINIDGLWYKIGLHNFPYMHINGEWLKSNKTRGEIEKAIALAKERREAGLRK